MTYLVSNGTLNLNSINQFVSVAVGSRLVANVSSSSLTRAGYQSDDDPGIEFEALCKMRFTSFHAVNCCLVV